MRRRCFAGARHGPIAGHRGAPSRRIAGARGIALDWRIVQESCALACDTALTERLARAIAALGYPLLALPSGAGHDGVAIAALTPIAMLFVRCKGGVSHNPAESVDLADVGVAIDVLGRFLLELRTED